MPQNTSGAWYALGSDPYVVRSKRGVVAEVTTEAAGRLICEVPTMFELLKLLADAECELPEPYLRLVAEAIVDRVENAPLVVTFPEDRYLDEVQI